MQATSPTNQGWQQVHPKARNFCAHSGAVVLLVIAVAGLLSGVIAYHVATGQLALPAFSALSLPTSCAMIGACSVIFIISVISLGYICKTTSNA